VGSPKRESWVFTTEEDATEHIGLDHFPTSAPSSPTGSPTPSARRRPSPRLTTAHGRSSSVRHMIFVKLPGAGPASCP
jgi:hypothetical protein